MERERRGLQDGNDRIATIARWLSQPVKSESVHELVLSCWCGDDAPQISARWDREDVSRELAPEINSLIQDYANDQGMTSSAQLTWVTNEDRPWTSKAFRARPEKGREENVRALDGSMVGIVQQLQRHNEASIQTLVDFVSKSEERWERMFVTLERQSERLEQRLHAAEDERSELELAAEQAIEVAERAAAEAEEAKRQAEEAAKDDRVGKVVELAIKQLSSGGLLPTGTGG